MASTTLFKDYDEMAEMATLPPFELRALKESVAPETAMEKLEFCEDGFEDTHIRNTLRRIAATLYCHQRHSTRYQSQMLNSRNTLLVFLSAMHRRQPQQDVSGALGLKRIDSAEMVKLCDWKPLYYAIIAEIRRLQEDLEAHFTKNRDSTLLLHTFGKECENIYAPFTMANLGEQLVEFWQLLMDHRLIGTLEEAVRFKDLAASNGMNMSDDQSVETKAFVADWRKSNSKEEKRKQLRARRGMHDAASMKYHDVVEMLWSDYISIADETYAAAEETELYYPGGVTRPCICKENCACKMACDYGVPGECYCQFKKLQATPNYLLDNVPCGVPSTTPIRRVKDPFPIDLYGPQRERHLQFVPNPTSLPLPAPAIQQGQMRQQKFVRAGGLVPLGERAEISFALPGPEEPGVSMTLAEVFGGLGSSRGGMAGGEVEARRPSEEGRKGFWGRIASSLTKISKSTE